MNMELDDLPPRYRAQAEQQLAARKRRAADPLAEAVKQAKAAGRDFDSRGEYEFYTGTVLPKMARGEIVECEQHPAFPLFPAGEYGTMKLRPIRYTADFCPNNAMKYDDKEMPSIMVFIPKFRLCDVLSTADTSVHPAFRVNGVEINGFWVGKYQTSHYNGRAYSLPGENPANTAGLDTFVSYNRAKGGKFHEITCAEWAAILKPRF